MKRNHRVWGNFWLQNGALGSPRQVPKPSLAAPREPKGVSRQPLCLLFGSPRHLLWASSSLLALPRCLQELSWELGDQTFCFRRFGDPKFYQKSRICQSCFWYLLSLFAITYSKWDFGLKLLVFLIDEMVDLSRARGSFVQSPTLDIHTSRLNDGQRKAILEALCATPRPICKYTMLSNRPWKTSGGGRHEP